MRAILILFLVFVAAFSTKAQVTITPDSTAEGQIKSVVELEKDPKTPKRASIYSAILPGAGHIYLKKYHKTAIIWAGIGTGIGLSFYWAKEHRIARDSYIAILDGDPNTSPDPEYENPKSNDELLSRVNDYRGWRDMSIIFTSLGYVLNIVWASVDAHLLYFDVSEDLGLNIRPSLNYFTKPRAGLTLALTLK